MKKKVGTLRGKPIVEGDSNLVKKTEIDVSTIGNASTEDEYVYICFPANTFNSSKFEELNESMLKCIYTIFIIIEFCDKPISSIRTWYDRIFRFSDTNIINENDSTLQFDIYSSVYIRFSKILENTSSTGVSESYTIYTRGDYKKFISEYSNNTLDANILNPYLISKEEWDNAVEETYKNYEEIREL